MAGPISRFAFPRSTSFPERPAAAGGAAHDRIVDALDASLQRAVEQRDAIETDVMPAKRAAARTTAAGESYRAVAATIVPYGRDLAHKLADARSRAGLSRKLNPNDIQANSGLRFDDLDLSARVTFCRVTLPQLSDSDLIRVVREIFDPSQGKPDVVAAYAIDSSPFWVREAIERRAAVSLDAMRETLLARLDPAAAATYESIEYLASQADYLLERAQRVLEATWGPDATRGDVFDPARDALTAALRKRAA